MAKLIKKKDMDVDDKGDKVVKPKDKIHLGFEIKTGISGYKTIKSIRADLKEKYSINDRTMAMSIAGELNPDFDAAILTIESTIKLVEDFVKNKSKKQVVDLIIGE